MQDDWLLANQRALMREVASVRAAVERNAEHEDGSPPARDERIVTALDRVCRVFGLSAFERKVLVMCAAMELDGSFAQACPCPSFGLALATFKDAHWSALTPHGPLRRWSLLTVERDGPLTAVPLRIDETILHELTGVPEVDARLKPFLGPPLSQDDLPASQREPIERIARLLLGRDRAPVFVQLSGRDAGAIRSIACAAFIAIGAKEIVIDARALPRERVDRDRVAEVYAREARLHGTALFLDAFDIDDTQDERAIVQFAENAPGAVIVGVERPLSFSRRNVYNISIDKPTRTEQLELWLRHLAPLGDDAFEASAALAGHYEFSGERIRACAGMAQAELGPDVRTRAWRAACASARCGLDELAQRLDGSGAATVLVLPPAQRDALRDIVAHARNRSRVYEEWGMGRSVRRGLGLSALFYGPSGTGKTLAAEAIGADLGVDVYRIDLSQLVSKYIGETEKNLRRIFDAAEDGGAVLLFDECDALFGKRGEVHFAHDRYANVEVSYLLQRMESYRGIAILTTNMRNAIDPAFLRRLRFVIAFPFPDYEQRLAMWQRSFPSEVPNHSLDFSKIAKLNVAGGNIRNICLHAAFIAADAGEPVGMGHILHAARTECAKIERVATALEIGDWV